MTERRESDEPDGDTDHDTDPGVAAAGRPSPGRAVLVAVGLTLAGVLAGAVFGLVPFLLAALATGTLDTSVPTIAASLATTMVGYATVGIAYARRYSLSIPARVPGLREVGWVVAGVVVALLLVSAVAAVVGLLGLDAAQNAIGSVGESAPVFFLVAAVLSVLLVGPGEELLFRGAIQGRLRRAFGPVVAIGTASALFAGIHALAVVGSVGATLVTVSVLIVPSLVLGVVYERTRNIVVPALVHGLYNATLLTGAYVAATAGV